MFTFEKDQFIDHRTNEIHDYSNINDMCKLISEVEGSCCKFRQQFISYNVTFAHKCCIVDHPYSFKSDKLTIVDITEDTMFAVKDMNYDVLSELSLILGTSDCFVDEDENVYLILNVSKNFRPEKGLSCDGIDIVKRRMNEIEIIRNNHRSVTLYANEIYMLMCLAILVIFSMIN